MADSEMTSAVRMRLLIAEDSPHILGYDQDEYAHRLFYTERPIEASLQAFRYARETAADIAERLTAIRGRIADAAGRAGRGSSRRGEPGIGVFRHFDSSAVACAGVGHPAVAGG